MIILEKKIEKKNEYHKLNSDNVSIRQISKNTLLAFSSWKILKNQINAKKIEVALLINSDENFDLIKEDLNNLSMIQINFINFKDGRPYTIAKELRRSLQFKGEIRASGDILPDQYVFLLRRGFDTVEIERSQKDTWIELLELDDGNYYQP